jgi:hypothetical protein
MQVRNRPAGSPVRVCRSRMGPAAAVALGRIVRGDAPHRGGTGRDTGKSPDGNDAAHDHAAIAGMLFVFPEMAKHCMWMRNTLVPLSVAFP